MKRLIFSVGTWQLMMVASALRDETKHEHDLPENYLVLYGDYLSHQLRQSMMQLTDLSNWQRIIWAEDLLTTVYTTEFNPQFVAHLLQERIGVTNFDEIWVCKLFHPMEKFILDAYPQAAIVLYDDGVGSYIQRQCIHEPENAIFSLLHPTVVCSRHIKRLTKIYFLLAEILGTPDYLNTPTSEIINLSQDSIKDVISHARNISGLAEFSKSQGSKESQLILVLGQDYSKWNYLSRSEELSIYHKAISTLIDLGFTVLWKEHPRTDNPFFTEIVQNIPSNKLLELDIPFALPVELIAEQLGLVGCVSISSTSLFSLYKFFNITPYTIINSFSKPIQSFIDADLFLTKRLLHIEHIQKTSVNFSLNPQSYINYPFAAKLTENKLLEINQEFNSPRFLNKLDIYVKRFLKGETLVLENLRQFRQQIAMIWLSSASTQLESLYLGYLGKAHQILLTSSIKHEPLTDIEKGFVAELIAIMCEDENLQKPQTFNCLLAVMLYGYADKLPVQYDLTHIPKWLLDDYCTFLFSTPRFFWEIGELDRYYQYIYYLIDNLHKCIIKNLNNAFWLYIANKFVEKSNFQLYYLNDNNVKDTLVKRAEIIKLFLKLKRCVLDCEFAEKDLVTNKLRVGILAEQFGNRYETFISLPVYENLIRDFEVVLYSLSQSGEPLEKYCQSCANSFKILPKTLKQQVELIRDDNLDILFIANNLNSTVNEVLLIAMHKLARIQIASSLSLVTTGISNFDYYLSTDCGDLGVNLEQQYREKLLQMESSGYCINPNLQERSKEFDIGREKLRAKFNLSHDHKVFICGIHQIIPEFNLTLSNLLINVSNSVLILFSLNDNCSSSDLKRALLYQLNRVYLGESFLIENRLIILEGVYSIQSNDIKEYLKIADVCLDTYPFSDVYTVINSLGVNLPVVARSGKSYRNLQSAAILHKLGLDSLVAIDEASYIELAISLSTNSQFNQQIRDEIRSRILDYPKLFNSQAYSNEVSLLFREIFVKRQEKIITNQLTLKEINFIVFPDWLQSEENIVIELANLLRVIAVHPDRSKLTLLIDTNGINEVELEVMISGIAMQLLLEENLEIDEEFTISPVSNLSDIQWEALLSNVQARIALGNENLYTISQLRFQNLSVCSLDNLRNIQINPFLENRTSKLVINQSFSFINSLGSKPRIDVVLQTSGMHGWSCSHGWVNVLKKADLLNRVFTPTADWEAYEPKDDDGLFEYLNHPQSDIMLLLGFDWHSQSLHNSFKWQDKWSQASVIKLAVLQECYSSTLVESTIQWQDLLQNAIFSTLPCVDGIICHHEPDIDFFQTQKNISLPIIFLPFGIDPELFKIKTKFSERLNRAVFRGNTSTYFTQKTYSERRYFLEVLNKCQHVDLFEFQLSSLRNPLVETERYVDELNSYQLLLNLPSMSPTLTARPFEIMACGGLLLQNNVIGNESNKLLQDWQNVVYYNADEPNDLITKIQYLLATPKQMQEIATQGHQLCYEQHTLINRINSIFNWLGCNSRI